MANSTKPSRRRTVGADALAQYDSLVERLATGEDVEFTELCVVLSAAGRRADELAHDIAAATDKQVRDE